MKDFIENLKQQLQEELPGRDAQYRMSHIIRKINDKPAPEDARVACVMSLFYQKDDAPYLTFIQRTSKNVQDHHRGQIGFPGGKLETSDPTYEAAALRETEEEVGVNANDIKVLGELTPLYIPISNFLVHVFVGYVDYVPDWKLQEEEVDAVIEVPYSLFQNKENWKQKDMRIRENVTLRNVPYFDLGQHTLWGATAMMMNELFEVAERKSF